ncbi:putative ATP-binding cassette transporter [Cantharellus anzutake]|uniref:putative ATP-binding cassette transporter n=1 Tax=Cantharellus anzutake TaxID=1750568 RepID=UPI001905337C|nr:putative ATP-binding cassette transporter [Cantharellus anzutake]KAF8319504.1 putative ATP-binding cassette transporter [Cantharellus anzutake]
MNIARVICGHRSVLSNGVVPDRKDSFLSRLLPPSLVPPDNSSTNLKQIVALGKPEKKTLLTAVGLIIFPLKIPSLILIAQHMFLNLSPSVALLGLLGIFTVGAMANTGRVLLMRLAGQRIIARLRQALYSSALRQEVEFSEKDPGVGDVMSRLSADTNIVGESITNNLSDGLRYVTIDFGLMIYLSPKLTLVMLSVVPPIALGSFIYGRYLKRLSNATQEALGKMSNVANESLSALRTVQASNARKWEEKRFAERVNDVLGLGRKEALASAIFFGSTGWAGNLTILTLLGYGGTLVSRGEISVGDLTSLLLYSAYTTVMRALGASARVFSLVDRGPSIPTNTGVPIFPMREGIVRFENVTFAYPSRPEVKVLKDFSLEIPVGGSTAIVGKSGSGKSSIQSLLLRFYDPLEGKVTFNGRDIRDFDVQSWRSLLSIVPQEPVLFEGTIASNIAYGAPDTPRNAIKRAARQANCDFIWDMPARFETKIGRSSLSGGQRQRIAIARALLKQPSLLCLDEATSALDAVSELRVNQAIEKILESRHTTSIIVAHRLSTISRAERIVVLEDGRIVEEGRYKDLAARPDSRFRALMDAQLEATMGEKENAASEGADDAVLGKTH